MERNYRLCAFCIIWARLFCVFIVISFVLIQLTRKSASASAATDPAQLLTIWNDKAAPDTIRLDAVYEYIWSYLLDDYPDSAIMFAQRQYEFANTIGHKNYMQRALNCQALALTNQSKFPEAIVIFNQALGIVEKMGNKFGVAGTLTNLGSCYNDQGNYIKAIEVYSRALSIHEEIKNAGGLNICLNAIGWLYLKQGNGAQAKLYFERALKIAETSKDEGSMADSYNNLANVSQHQQDYKKAKEYLDKAYDLFLAEGNRIGVTTILGNIGMNYVKTGDFVNARIYYKQALATYEKMGYKGDILRIAFNLGIVDNKEGKYTSALAWCSRSLVLAEEIGNIDFEEQACECMYVAHKGLGNTEKALIYHERMLSLEAAMNKADAGKKLQQMEFEKEMLQDSIAKAEAARQLQEAHQKEVRQKNKSRNIALGMGGVVLLVAGGLYSRLRFVKRSKAVLQVEKDRSEHLLLNILPEEIAAELKANGKAEARDFDLVSILFTDFKGFTEQSAKLSASELVGEINYCFEGFDGIMEKYGIEKIKTIGDAYMAAGGLPIPTNTSVKNTVLAALEMQSFIQSRKKYNDKAGKAAFEMRVGIHTGPVVAGIVGVKKFQYDIWGDTVNTASRIESAGEVGRVNISQSTYELLQHDPEFLFENRGKIEAKGKGEIEMWFISLSAAAV